MLGWTIGMRRRSDTCLSQSCQTYYSKRSLEYTYIWGQYDWRRWHIQFVDIQGHIEQIGWMQLIKLRPLLHRLTLHSRAIGHAHIVHSLSNATHGRRQRSGTLRWVAGVGRLVSNGGRLTIWRSARRWDRLLISTILGLRITWLLLL